MLNVFVAAVIGGFLEAVPTRIVRRVALTLVAIIIVGFAVVMVIGTIEDRKSGSARARADEEYAERLYKSGEFPAAVMKLRDAGSNWRIAGRADEQERVDAKAVEYASDSWLKPARPAFTPPAPVPDDQGLAATTPTPGMFDDLIPAASAKEAAAQRARANELSAEQSRRQGKLVLAKAHLLKAAENWQLANRPDQAQRVRAKATGVKMPTAGEFLDFDEIILPATDPLEGFDPDAALRGEYDEKKTVDDPLAGFDPDEVLKNHRPAKPTPSPKR